MIRLDRIGKRLGDRILFIEASAALNRGEKIGLVGPNGAGEKAGRSAHRVASDGARHPAMRPQH